MQAIILAAGSGKRLERVSKGLPKCLLPINGAPLIEHQLEAFSDAGIGKVLVVVGHKADEVRKTLGNRVEYIENTRYEETNSLYSLWLARDWVKEPFLLLNCDLLFHPDILDRLLTKGGNALAFDSLSSKGKEQTKVIVKEGRVIDLGKDLPSDLARGESLGMILFNDRGSHALFSRVHALIQNGGENSWVIEAVSSVCSAVDMSALNVAGMPWVEVDFPNDLERAHRVVWPAILKSRWKRTIHWRKTKYVAMAFIMAVLVSAGLYVGSRAGVEKVHWNISTPAGGKEVFLKLPTGSQRWWVTSQGRPLRVSLVGPAPVRVDTRLLMPAGTTEPGKYVLQISVDGKPHLWSSFKATPALKVPIKDAIVGDRDGVKFDMPEGKHIIEVDLLAGTSSTFLGRISYPEPISLEENEEDEELVQQ